MEAVGCSAGGSTGEDGKWGGTGGVSGLRTGETAGVWWFWGELQTLDLRVETVGLELRSRGFCLWILFLSCFGSLFFRSSKGVFNPLFNAITLFGVHLRGMVAVESDFVRLDGEVWRSEVWQSMVFCLERVTAPGGLLMNISLI